MKGIQSTDHYAVRSALRRIHHCCDWNSCIEKTCIQVDYFYSLQWECVSSACFFNPSIYLQCLDLELRVCLVYCNVRITWYCHDCYVCDYYELGISLQLVPVPGNLCCDFLQYISFGLWCICVFGCIFSCCSILDHQGHHRYRGETRQGTFGALPLLVDPSNVSSLVLRCESNWKPLKKHTFDLPNEAR